MTLTEDEISREKARFEEDIANRKEEIKIFDVATAVTKNAVDVAIRCMEELEKLGHPFIDSPEYAEAAKKAFYKIEEALTAIPGIEAIPENILSKYIFNIVITPIHELELAEFNRLMAKYLEDIHSKKVQLKYRSPGEKFSWEDDTWHEFPGISGARLARIEIISSGGDGNEDTVHIKIFQCKENKGPMGIYKTELILEKGTY